MHQIVAASDQEVGGLAVILPPLYEIFWSALVLLIVLLLVGRYALPRIYKTMDERAAKIEEGLGAASQAKARSGHRCTQAQAALKRTSWAPAEAKAISVPPSRRNQRGQPFEGLRGVRSSLA